MHRASIAVFACMLVFCVNSHAQSTFGSIVGTVVDPSGLPVVKASVRLVQPATGAQREASSNETGDFFFGSLQPGEYNLTVEMTGFKRLERRSINVSAAERLSVGNLGLEVGAPSESVEVVSQGVAVQTATAERAGVIVTSQVETLAIRGRNVMSLLQLMPGVVDTGEPEQLQSNWSLNVQGNRTATNNVSIDGATVNAIGNNNNAVVQVGMDAVAEVKILVSNYQAEYGRMSGSNVHIVTKSGTRDFHGLGSYFKRHEQFNANNFFNNMLGQPKPRYRFNTWNYNVGGPVYIPGKFNRNRDKLFFFWAQEFWPLRVTSAITQLTVPTELERAGDFSNTLDVNNRQIVVNDPLNNKTPFPGNRIPAARLHASGVALLKVFPLPNMLDRNVSRGNYNYVFQAARETPIRSETLKIDYHINASNMLGVNYSHKKDEQRGAVGMPAGAFNWPGIEQYSLNDGKIIIGQFRHIFDSSFISETNASFSRRPWNNTIEEKTLAAFQRDKIGYTLGQFNPAGNPLKLIPQAAFGGVLSAANLSMDGRFPLTSEHDIFTASHTMTKMAGAHLLKAGLYVDRVFAINSIGTVFNGSFDFGRNVNNPLDTNYAYSNAALGVFNTYTEASARPLSRATAVNMEWFVQDNWRVTRRLTLDYGLRMAWIRPSGVEGDRLSSFVPERYSQTARVQLIQPAVVNNVRVGVHPVTGATYPAAQIGATAPGVGNVANGLVVAADDAGYPRALIDDRGVHFGPRVGFAYNVFGNGKTAVRGGFGIFYNRVAQSGMLYPFAEQAPMVQNPVIQYGAMPTLLQSSGLVFPTNILGVARGGEVPTVYSYSFSVQQDVGFGTVLDVGYVGSLGRHLLAQRNLNSVPFGTNFNPANIDRTTNSPLPAAFLVPYIGYNAVNFREWGSTSNYHSLQMTATRRFARNIEFGGSWTWSKAMDFVDGDESAVSNLVPIRVWNYGLAGFDRTHALKVNWLWTLPKAPTGNPVLKMVVNNWQVSGIASFVSGAPLGVGYSLVTAADITGSPTDGARIVVNSNPVLAKSERTFARNFRTDVFAPPARGTIGNSAKTIIRGPGINNWDLAIFKTFPIREPMRFQLRWELYNAFNHTQFSGLDTSARFDAQGNQVNTRLGAFIAARSPRLMQFALRFQF